MTRERRELIRSLRTHPANLGAHVGERLGPIAVGEGLESAAGGAGDVAPSRWIARLAGGEGAGEAKQDRESVGRDWIDVAFVLAREPERRDRLADEVVHPAGLARLRGARSRQTAVAEDVSGAPI